MARVFFTVLSAVVALAVVMAIPYPQDSGAGDGAAATTAAPAGGSNGGAPIGGFDVNDCKAYEERCKNGTAQGSQFQNNTNNPLQNNTNAQNSQADVMCNNPQMEAFCKQMNSQMNMGQLQNNTQFNQNAINQAPVFGPLANSSQNNNFNAIQQNVQNPQQIMNPSG